MPRKRVIQKRRGRPATGNDPVRSFRMPDELADRIDHWSTQQEDQPSRAEAIRRLVDIGLTVERPKQTSEIRARKAQEMAGEQLDQLADQSATTAEQASRKRRLLKGPEEFREVRVDRPGTTK
jgi:Arc/MetJ-type ribon-helix-helix transcriptional regulator